jgi:FixJ family two-component response regulator
VGKHEAGSAEKPCCIAVIDDDGAVLDALRFSLGLDGFDVDTYSNGSDFLAGMSTHPPACVILDQHMPGMTGLEIAARLRADGCTLPIIMLSGAVDPKLEGRAFALGISRVIAKPLEGDLGQIIHQCIAESRTAH